MHLILFISISIINYCLTERLADVRIQADWPHGNWMLTEVRVITELSETSSLSKITADLKDLKIDTVLMEGILSMRFFAARTEAIRKSVSETPPCNPYIWNGSNAYCDLDSLLSGRVHTIESDSFDRVYGKGKPEFLIVGSIGKQETMSLLKKAMNSHHSFAFRPFVHTKPKSIQFFDSSFGVCFESLSSASSSTDDLSQFLQKSSLKHIEKSPKTPSKDEQSQMALKVIQVVQSSSNPFDALSMISHNYPLLKNVTANCKPSEGLRQSMGRISPQLFAVQPKIYINGLEGQSEFFDAFSLTRFLILLKRHSVSPEEIETGIISSWFKRKVPYFNVQFNEAVVVLNDLEKDDRYFQWPKKIEDTFRPSRSIFKMIALNLVSCVIIVDMADSGASNVITGIIELIEQNVPIRFGLVISNLPESTVSFFYGILTNLGLPEALKFVLEIQSISVEEYVTKHPRIRTMKYLQDYSLQKDSKRSLEAYKKLVAEFDINNQEGHFAIVNGRAIKLSGDTFENSLNIFKAYQEEMRDIQMSYRKDLLKENDIDYYTTILSSRQSHLLKRSHKSYAPFALDLNTIDDSEYSDNAILLPNNMEVTEKIKRTIQAFGKGVDIVICSKERNNYDELKKTNIGNVVKGDYCDNDNIYYYSKGRKVKIDVEITKDVIQLMKEFDKMYTMHLSKFDNMGKIRRKQDALMEDLQVELRALFPTLEPEPPNLNDLPDPIIFGTRNAPIRITTIMNPLSLFSQRLLAILREFGADIIQAKIYLIAPINGPEPAFNSYYRWIGSSDDASWELPSGKLALQLDCPNNWALKLSQASGDMDNIEDRANVQAVYQLKALTIEGNAINIDTKQAAAGVQVALMDRLERLDESIVMGNFGYYQQSASPGSYNITVGGEAIERVKIDRLDSLLIERLKISKNKVDASNKQADKDFDEEEEVINVFSIATGASYEQLLRIMMLSAVKHTKHKLVFWLINSLVSPHLRRSLDILSLKYSFQVRYMHYKWPSWLTRPNSRRLVAWASKVLLLDVLFPLDLKRVIFVDADQVIRDDLYKLYTIDLEGHVYGMTAFCDSRREAEGYRFWKTGYWKEFLNGRPYFISALLVIDLELLRSSLTGDLLRWHYMRLSKDPNSLNNLDQDLLNHLQPQVPIFQLPGDWLWCEAWCSADSKKTAKIIDLCSNPGKTESKLESARRIIPEWESLNNEVLKEINNVQNEEGEERDEL